MRRTKEDQEQFEGNEDGGPREFDENRAVPAIQLIKTGLAIMANEIDRLTQKSKDTGLNGMQAMMLKEYVRTASDIHKRHKELNLDWLSHKELETISDDELVRKMIEAVAVAKIDISDMTVQRPPRKQRVISHED